MFNYIQKTESETLKEQTAKEIKECDTYIQRNCYSTHREILLHYSKQEFQGKTKEDLTKN